MLNLIKDIENPLLEYVKDDPVRPDLPVEFRISNNRFIGALVADKPEAIVCVSLHNFVPESVDDLRKTTTEFNTAIFYTIWSYRAGAATELLTKIVAEIRAQYPSVSKFVTLSPKTEMARRFHLKNGASIFRENSDTINYEYTI